MTRPIFSSIIYDSSASDHRDIKRGRTSESTRRQHTVKPSADVIVQSHRSRNASDDGNLESVEPTGRDSSFTLRSLPTRCFHAML